MLHEPRSDDVPGAPDGSGQSGAAGLRRWRSALYGATAALWFATPAAAQQLTPQEGLNLQQEIRAQQQQIQREQRQLYLESLRLDDQQRLLDSELGKLRATGTGAAAAVPLPPPPSAPPSAPGETPATSPPPAAQAAAPISGPSVTQRETRRVLETAQELSSKGGVLTPKGVLVIDPSIEYDYWNQNQVSISGFTIIPGITFGNINVQRVQANYVTTALTFRYGVTNRFEINLKLPLVYATGSTITQPLGPNAQIFSPHADAFAIGDVQAGASYQLNSGEDGWPIFIANALFKSATGTSPFDVPIYTTGDPNGLYIAGIQKKLPTGTGFDTIEPNITMLIPTSPAVLFANIAYGVNIARGVEIANRSGGAPTSATIGPGNFIAGTFGVGFAVNDQTSMTFSYQQEHVWPTTENGAEIAGSSFDFGTFNFGLGFAINRNITVNLGAGIGVGPNNPVARILIEVPIRLTI
ncbi:MAG: hypothetical protein ACREFS_08235 [Acetobacteraceae bacterium]